MPSVCLYFQVHQPHRLRKYSFFDIGHVHDYYDDIKNREILQKIALKCYLPTNTILLQLIKQFEGRFKVAFSLSGTVIEQFKRFSPETLNSFKALVDTGCVEILNETYNHSLSAVFSKQSFIDEIKLHSDLIYNEFGYKASTFRNTELIYNNDTAELVSSLGYKTMLAEGADKILAWRSPNFLYQAHTKNPMNLLLKNYRLSDDIAFRFSNKEWAEYPLTADKFSTWAHAVDGAGDIINLFMDYETFGEHQWSDTGIFQFLEHLPAKILAHPQFDFCLPCEVASKYPPLATLDIPSFYSWADTERDLTAWTGNDMQQDAFQTIYELEKLVRAVDNRELEATWRALLTSDHFYYMCTKWSADGDVHKYFNHYDNPYDAYVNYQNIIKDFRLSLNNHLETQKKAVIEETVE
ncbi:MAG: polysaccharide deacetylase family protein [Legionellales bacterium]|nr:polysaccharide deacetylase family protein [Legionellales bacterium]